MAFPISIGYKDINPTNCNTRVEFGLSLYRRRSYKTEVMNLGPDSKFAIDEDNSKEHLLLVIQEYKRRIASFSIIDKESFLLEALKRGLCIEEELLATQQLNNNAKSAYFKK